MPGPYTIDASVFLNGSDARESGSAVSFEFLRRAGILRAAIIEPTLVLPEVAASAARSRGDVRQAIELVDAIRRSVNIRFIPLDNMLADFAVSVATRSRLRGSDAVYGAVAQRYSAMLVTLDREQRQRLDGFVVVHTPEEALALL